MGVRVEIMQSTLPPVGVGNPGSVSDTEIQMVGKSRITELAMECKSPRFFHALGLSAYQQTSKVN